MENTEFVRRIKMEKIKVLVSDEITARNGNKFRAYKVVDETNGGKLIDLRFKREADPSVLDDCRKAYITVQSYNIAKNYEYPRAYAGKIISVEKIC